MQGCYTDTSCDLPPLGPCQTEWEYAAKGGLEGPFPWGRDPTKGKLNVWQVRSPARGTWSKAGRGSGCGLVLRRPYSVVRTWALWPCDCVIA